MEDAELAKRRGAEKSVFDKMEVVHSLPLIQSYWTQRYLRPKFAALGYKGIEDFNLKVVLEGYNETKGGRLFVIASIGSGNCDREVSLAKRIKEAGIGPFVFHCYDLSDAMLERGRQSALDYGLQNEMEFHAVDLNAVDFGTEEFDIFYANQSLHHMVNLEGMFDQIIRGLRASGTFLVGDMIGRNGHMAWPEALRYIDAIWRSLADEKKYHHVLKKRHGTFPNTDFSTVGFEGVRAQDILPLMLDRFVVDTFLGVQAIIRPFISRGYGPNYSVDTPSDCAIIDFIARLDENLIESGELKPIMAFMRLRKTAVRPQQYVGRQSAQFCVRRPDL